MPGVKRVSKTTPNMGMVVPIIGKILALRKSHHTQHGFDAWRRS